MIHRLVAALSGAAFFVALGIVGAVENGAPASRLWLTLPLLALTALGAKISQRNQKFSRATPPERVRPTPARGVN